MARKLNRLKKYYFTDRLKSKLAQIKLYPLTVAEAPAGYGKTTAIKEYLQDSLPDAAGNYWYTCLGESAVNTWNGICGLFANFDPESAALFRKLGMPTIDTLSYLLTLVQKINCEKEICIVIDNFHLARCDVPNELINVFSAHDSPHLHIIFITQQLPAERTASYYSANALIIDSDAFRFNQEGIAGLFRLEGIRLSEGDLQSVCQNTGGWIAAIRLQILHYQGKGVVDRTTDIDRLVESAIWNRLADAEKRFLLSVSVLDSFTVCQAAAMIGEESPPEYILRLLRTNGFIRFYPDKNEYVVHAVLRDYLQRMLFGQRPESEQRRVFRLAGQTCAARSLYFTAAEFFFRIKDFNAVLSLPPDGEHLEHQREKRLTEFIVSLVDECPAQTLCRYPEKMVVFAYPMLLDGRLETFERLCVLMDWVIGNNPYRLSSGEINWLKGEYTFLKSFTAYNDIRRMSAGRRAALEILGGPSSIIVDNMPWTFGCTSVLNMFWRESGKLDEELCDMDGCLPYYRKLTRGHGTGADSVFRAEAMLMRGEDISAEEFCHKALYDARAARQISICICAEQVLAQIAILRGDAEMYSAAVSDISRYPEEHSELYVLRLAELSLSFVDFTLGFTGSYAKWLYDCEAIERTLYAPAVPYARILYSEHLAAERRHGELYGISGSVLEEAKNAHYLLPQVYHLICLAAAKKSDGDSPAAKEYLSQALALAIPDRVYLPFARQACIADLLPELGQAERYLSASPKDAFGSQYSEAVLGIRLSGSIAALKSLCRRQQKGVRMIKAVIQKKSPLTPREREIAQLASARLSAREIAEKLFISEGTVNATLKNVYSKLDIHSKTELKTVEF